jgi:hypothetical protein
MINLLKLLIPGYFSALDVPTSRAIILSLHPDFLGAKIILGSSFQNLAIMTKTLDF